MKIISLSKLTSVKQTMCRLIYGVELVHNIDTEREEVDIEDPHRDFNGIIFVP
ncbi:hypothetical protein ACFL14_00375 [Patescibacteria group bacterium]